jgi:hypothetical protein
MVLPAGISVPPWVVVFSASRNVPLIGLSIRSVSSMNRGISSRCSRSRCWSPGSSQISRSAVLSSRTVVSCPAENRLAAIRATSTGSGSDPSGKRLGHAGEHVAPRLGPQLLDALGEVAVEEVQWVMGNPVVLTRLADHPPADAGLAELCRYAGRSPAGLPRSPW